MVVPDDAESPLASSTAVDSAVTDAFALLANETRLAILLGLWEATDPADPEAIVSFSDLYERVGVRDSGNFTYHLDKLLGHFVEETESGYRLRNAGEKIVQAVVSGAGLESVTVPPTSIPRTCHRCGARVELSYEAQYLYHRCPSCEGNLGPASRERAPEGTLMAHDFEPAGVAHRTPEEAFVASSIAFLRDVGLLVRGVCPQCAGTVDGTYQICESHDAPAGEVCEACGTRDEVRVAYECTVCKYGSSFPAEGAVHDHPAVVAHRYEHGIQDTYDLDDPAACGSLWNHLMAYEHELLSTDPVRVRVQTPGDDPLELVLDEDVAVVDVGRSARGD